ncbi:MAG: hypothetical protein U9N76_03180 [Candidatus Marinimicrobia bacterium]|nr:hypothetical protein [Candidatus Neomarinimicrobiota bacterium]
MSKKHFLISFFLILIIVFVFILPEMLPDSFDQIISMYAQKDDVLTDVAHGKGDLSTVKYLFKLDIYLELFSKIIGAVSLLGLLYQFKRDKDINEAEFVLNINNSFITNDKIMDVYKKLEQSKNDNQKTNPFVEDDIIELANYITFFEAFYGLIKQKVVNYSAIDQLAYRFFLITNNRFVQDMLLCKEGKDIAWIDLYKLHNGWKKYRTKSNDFDVWQKEYDLSKHHNYDNIVSNLKT